MRRRKTRWFVSFIVKQVLRHSLSTTAFVVFSDGFTGSMGLFRSDRKQFDEIADSVFCIPSTW
jgi:hypothetical protein